MSRKIRVGAAQISPKFLDVQQTLQFFDEILLSLTRNTEFISKGATSFRNRK